MKPKLPCLMRTIEVIVLALPLLTTGSCGSIVEQSIIDGFFNAVTPVVTDEFRQRLGLPAMTYDASLTGNEVQQ